MTCYFGYTLSHNEMWGGGGRKEAFISIVRYFLLDQIYPVLMERFLL